jgi:putative DNA primase/helicase
VVFDVDPRHRGDETLHQLEEKYGPLPETPTVLSGGGGKHFYFQHPGFYVSSNSDVLGAGLDIKGDGGAIVAPPSLHVSGQRYRWMEGRYPTVPLAPLPPWMLGRLQEPRRSGSQGSAGYQGTWDIGEDGLIQEGQRNNTLFRLALSLYRASLSENVIYEELVDWNMKHCIPPLPEHEVRQIAWSAARYAPDTPQEPLTDLGNARRFLAHHGRILRYVPSWKKWLIWDSTLWTVDEVNAVTNLAKETVRGLYEQVRFIEDPDKRRSFAQHVARSESHSRIVDMLKLAESEAGLAVTSAQLDVDPWALNVLNGTLDLQTGQLQKHRQEDLITKLAPVEYNPEAECPTWLVFLHRILGGDADLIHYVQKAVGYSLTGSIAEQCLFGLHGTGANGKSTLIQTLRALLGDYAMQTPAETLLLKSSDGPRSDLARLRGARFVAAVEVEQGRRFNEVLVKQLTGGDTVTARHLYGEFFEYQPTYKLWLAVNHTPTVRGTDHAIWRRIQKLPFTVTVPTDERDKCLAEKLQAELPGILRWAVEGCLAWQREGLEPPSAVQQATQAYRSEMDVVSAFIDQCCVVVPQHNVSSSDLYSAYTTWCKDMGETPISQKELASVLRERGCIPRHRRSGNFWYGIALRDDEAAAA